MAKSNESDFWDPTYMTLSKGGDERKVYFTDCLKNSSTMKEWIEHEKRVSDLILILRNLDSDFKDLQVQDPTVWVDVGKYFVTYTTSKSKLRKEFEKHLPFLKDKFQSSLKEILKRLESELEKRFENWKKTFGSLISVIKHLSHLKYESDLMKYFKLCDAKRAIVAEKTTIDNLIEQGARSSRVKMAIQKLQDNKAILDKSLETRRSLLKSDSLTILATAENVVTEMNPIIQQAMTDALIYIDSCNTAANDPLENIETPEVSGFESSELSKDDENRSHALDENHSPALEKSNANETLDKGLKMLREANQSTLFLRINDRFDNPSFQPQSATPGSQKRFSLTDYSPTRTLAMSEPAKKAGSNVGSNVSKMSERRWILEIQAELMDQKSQMEIEKRERELELEKTCMEMEKKLQELQAESEIAELKRKKAFERQQMRLQIEEAEGSFRASSICPSLMSLTLEEDKNSDIKSWLDQGVEGLYKCFSQPKESSREVGNKGESSKPSQKFQTFDHKNLLSRTQGRGSGESPPRKNTGITFPKTNTLLQQGNEKPKPKNELAKPSFKIESEYPSFTPAVPVQQPVHFVQTSLPKLKLSDFHGDPLERPEWSSLFTATIHNAPIDDNAKMSHLKTLVKGKAKAAIAGLGYSGVMYSAAWKALVTNFGRPQTIVNAQTKQIHLSPFIKSHVSAAIIKYAQLITTCVTVLKQSVSQEICIPSPS